MSSAGDKDIKDEYKKPAFVATLVVAVCCFALEFCGVPLKTITSNADLIFYYFAAPTQTIISFGIVVSILFLGSGPSKWQWYYYAGAGALFFLITSILQISHLHDAQAVDITILILSLVCCVVYSVGIIVKAVQN